MKVMPEPLQNLLTQTAVTDICFNRFNQIFFDQGKGLEAWPHSADLFQNEQEYRAFVLEHISLSGKTWDAKLPFVDTIFFGTHRAHISFPPLAQYGIYLSLRKLPRRYQVDFSVAQARARERWASLSGGLSDGFEILIQSIQQHETIVIAGGTGSGKTTLLNDLLSFAEPHERLIGLEDTAEISPEHPHYLSLLSRPANADGLGAVTLRDLLRQTLRMRPDRVLLGECRGDEVLELLQALNTGHRGTLCTLHANSPREALKRIELLALIGARGTIPSSLIKELIVHGVQKVAHLEKEQGKRIIKSIIQLEGKEGETLLVRPLWSNPLSPEKRAARMPRGNTHHFPPMMLENPIKLNANIKA